MATQHWKFRATQKGDHMHVQVRCGETADNRPIVGSLTLHPDEWTNLQALLHEGVMSDHVDAVVVTELTEDQW